MPTLAQQSPDPLDLLWVGSEEGMERELVNRAGLPFEAISAAGLRGRNPLALMQALLKMAHGYRQSRRILARFQPDILFVTGGYVCVPITLAAWFRKIPILIYLPDIEPGLAIKFLARFATRVAVTAPEAQTFFKPGLTVVTGYPVRPDLRHPQADSSMKTGARQQFKLTDDLPVLLVFGGSRGARSLNQAITQDLDTYLNFSQIIHCTGSLHIAEVQAKRAALPQPLQARYHVYDYLHETMPLALHAADLVVSRAGASVLGEFPAVGLPAILVPYPYAGAHQTLNAEHLVNHGAAVMLKDIDIKSLLCETIVDIISNQNTLTTMSQATRALAQPNASALLAQQILEVSHGN